MRSYWIFSLTDWSSHLVTYFKDCYQPCGCKKAALVSVSILLPFATVWSKVQFSVQSYQNYVSLWLETCICVPCECKSLRFTRSGRLHCTTFHHCPVGTNPSGEAQPGWPLLPGLCISGQELEQQEIPCTLFKWENWDFVPMHSSQITSTTWQD